jgi:hypothetical protein
LLLMRTCALLDGATNPAVSSILNDMIICF